MTTKIKHTAKRIAPGRYIYMGCTIARHYVHKFLGDICSNPWFFQRPAGDTHAQGMTYSLKAAKSEIDFYFEKL